MNTSSHCVLQFRREDRLRAHLLLGSHKIITPPFRLLDKAVIVYKESLDNDNLKEIPILSAINTIVKHSAVRHNQPEVTHLWGGFELKSRES